MNRTNPRHLRTGDWRRSLVRPTPRRLALMLAGVLLGCTAFWVSSAATHARSAILHTGTCQVATITSGKRSRALLDHFTVVVDDGSHATLWGYGDAELKVGRVIEVCRSAAGTWVDAMEDSSNWFLTPDVPDIPVVLGFGVVLVALSYRRTGNEDYEPI
jgi:hypothetical protein